MANVIELDFDGAPPVNVGGGLGDVIPPGGYLLLVDKLVKTTSSNGKPMVNGTYVVQKHDRTEGKWVGKKIKENFTLPRAGEPNDSKVGLSRFHCMLVAAGGAEQEGKVKLDLDRVIGRTFVGEVEDEIIPQNGNYPERKVSRPNGYYSAGSTEGVKLMTLAQEDDTPAEDEGEAPAATEPETTADVVETPAAKETPDQPQSDTEEELDDLFG